VNWFALGISIWKNVKVENALVWRKKNVKEIQTNVLGVKIKMV